MSASHSAFEGSRSSGEKHNSKKLKREATQRADGHTEKSFRRHSHRPLSGLCRTSGTTQRDWGGSSASHGNDTAFHTTTATAAAAAPVASETWGSENMLAHSADVSIKGGVRGQLLLEHSVTDMHTVESVNGSAESSLTGCVGNTVRCGRQLPVWDPYESGQCTPFPARGAGRCDDSYRIPSKPSTKFSKGSASVVSNVLAGDWDDDATSPEKRPQNNVATSRRTPRRFRSAVHLAGFDAPTKRFALDSQEMDSSARGGREEEKSGKEGDVKEDGESVLHAKYVPPPYPVDFDWEE